MKSQKKVVRLMGAGFLAVTLILPGSLAAQEGANGSATITLTKMIDVHEFEDFRVTTEVHQVARGDTLLALLKKRGLLAEGGDEAFLMRLVRDFNPQLSDVNSIQAGQELVLPLALERIEANRQITVKSYERFQKGQLPARISVFRQEPDENAIGQKQETGVTAAAEAEKPETGGAAETADREDAEAQPGAAPVPAADVAARASSSLLPAEAGILEQAEDGTVYRIVKVQPGDTLERLLRREGMDLALIYQHLLKLTMRLNPAMTDPDLILAGAELKIPAAGDYLAALGSDPGPVKAETAVSRSAAVPEPAPSVKDVRAVPVKPAGPALPDQGAESARMSLELLFSRLGESIHRGSRLILPLSNGQSLDINTNAFPVIELSNGRRVILDLEAKLPREMLEALDRDYGDYKVFRPARGQALTPSLARLWPLCGYYLVHDKTQSYEGGGDLRIKITADWLVWPSHESWEKGQPLVINQARSPEAGTPPAWARFLRQNGLTIVDIYKTVVLPESAVEPAAAAGSDFSLVEIPEETPSLMAARLIEALGGQLRTDLDLDLEPGTAALPEAVTPVVWEHGQDRLVLEFGSLTPEAQRALLETGYQVLTCSPDQVGVTSAVLAGFGVSIKNDLVLTGTRPGGPKISLTLKGRYFTLDGQDYLLYDGPVLRGLGDLTELRPVIIRFAEKQ